MFLVVVHGCMRGPGENAPTQDNRKGVKAQLSLAQTETESSKYTEIYRFVNVRSGSAGAPVQSHCLCFLLRIMYYLAKANLQ